MQDRGLLSHSNVASCTPHRKIDLLFTVLSSSVKTATKSIIWTSQNRSICHSSNLWIKWEHRPYMHREN